MEGTLVHLLIFILILGAIYYIVTLIPIPDPFRKIALIVICVIALLYLISMLFGYGPLPLRR